MFLDIVRRIVPIKYRQSFGLWTAHQASRSKLLLYPYLLLLCGTVPKNLRLIPNDECIITYRGHEIISPRDSIFTSWEVLQAEIYEKVYRPLNGDVVVDIGAHIGLFSVKASLQVGSAGVVIAIEPAHSNRIYLRQNTLPLLNVRVVDCAVGTSEKIGHITTSEASPCHTLTLEAGIDTEVVKVDTLDNILSKMGIGKVDFIKIDAEGSELDILKGATNTLMNNKLKLAVASYHNLPNGEYELPYVQQFLISAGFSTTTIKEYVYADNLEVK